VLFATFNLSLVCHFPFLRSAVTSSRSGCCTAAPLLSDSTGSLISKVPYCRHLGYDTYFCRWLPTFRRNLSPTSYKYGRDKLLRPKASVTTYKTIRRHNPEDHNPNFHRHMNVKSYIAYPIVLFGNSVTNDNRYISNSKRRS
jgi:hypothetical protein